MAGFEDRPLLGPGEELQLTIDGGAVRHAEVLAGELVPGAASAGAAVVLEEPDAEAVNFFAVAELIAARAAAPSTRRQYAAIFRSFGDWVAREAGRPPTVSDLGPDVIAAWGRHLERRGGRGGGPAAPATRRIYLSMVRSLARELHGVELAAHIKLPAHRPGPPETLTESDYLNLLRVPDRRTQHGKRDYALLRLLGDCGLRSAELRGLEARDVRRPRANARHQRLYVRGKGGAEREVDLPSDTEAALQSWLGVHPLVRGRGLRDEQRLFVRLGRHPGSAPAEPLSAQAVHKLVRRCALRAGVAERLAHPHALRAYWATALLDDGVPVHVVSARLDHADLRTTARYAAERPSAVADIADILDRRHQAARLSRCA